MSGGDKCVVLEVRVGQKGGLRAGAGSRSQVELETSKKDWGLLCNISQAWLVHRADMRSVRFTGPGGLLLTTYT
jgi:hypothetical protein